MTTDPGSTLQHALSDRYRLERELGRGGMAVVYLARDVRHDRPVETHAYVIELTARARLIAGDTEGALAALAKYVEVLGPSVHGHLRVHPEYARLHGNPRFERLAAPARRPS